MVRYGLGSSGFASDCLKFIITDSSVRCARRGSAENQGRSSPRPLLFIIVVSGVNRGFSGVIHRFDNAR